jgi:hypothetical protein
MGLCGQRHAPDNLLLEETDCIGGWVGLYRWLGGTQSPSGLVRKTEFDSRTTEPVVTRYID